MAAAAPAAAPRSAKPSVSLKAPAGSATVGQALRLTGSVRNARADFTSVSIYEKGGAGWRRVATAKLTARHTFAAKVTPTKQGTWRLFAAYKYRTGAAMVKARSDVLAITVEAAPGEWAAIAGGAGHSLALKSDGSLWAWGGNSYGALGLGDYKNRNVPTRVGTANDWAVIAGGHGLQPGAEESTAASGPGAGTSTASSASATPPTGISRRGSARPTTGWPSPAAMVKAWP